MEQPENTAWRTILSKHIFFFLRRALPAIVVVLFCLCLPVFALADGADAADDITGALIITEVMVKNHAVVQDPEGDFPDWIELCNNSGEDLDLTGWSLTDRMGKDGLVFPSYLLPADAYFVVFASGKDRPADLSSLSFRLYRKPGRKTSSRIRIDKSPYLQYNKLLRKL